MGREHEEQVREWGFGHVFTWTDGPYVIPTISTPSPCLALSLLLFSYLCERERERACVCVCVMEIKLTPFCLLDFITLLVNVFQIHLLRRATLTVTPTTRLTPIKHSRRIS